MAAHIMLYRCGYCHYSAPVRGRHFIVRHASFPAVPIRVYRYTDRAATNFVHHQFAANPPTPHPY